MVLWWGRQRVTKQEMYADFGGEVRMLGLIQRASEDTKGFKTGGRYGHFLPALFYLWSYKVRLGHGPLATGSS